MWCHDCVHLLEPELELSTDSKARMLTRALSPGWECNEHRHGAGNSCRPPSSELMKDLRVLLTSGEPLSLHSFPCTSDQAGRLCGPLKSLFTLLAPYEVTCLCFAKREHCMPGAAILQHEEAKCHHVGQKTWLSATALLKLPLGIIQWVG